MNPCDVLYFLTVTVTVTTVTSQPVKFLPVSKDTNLNDLHMLLDEIRLKFHQQAKVRGTWEAFEETQQTLLKAVAMGTKLIEECDLTAQEGSDFLANEFKHLLGHVRTDPRLFLWVKSICSKGLPFPESAKEAFPEIIGRVHGNVAQFCDRLRTGDIKDIMNMEMDL